ncbi:hypothetical protein Hanom_Chr11g01020851 [Helianthus anomalus]
MLFSNLKIKDIIIFFNFQCFKTKQKKKPSPKVTNRQADSSSNCTHCCISPHFHIDCISAGSSSHTKKKKKKKKIHQPQNLLSLMSTKYIHIKFIRTVTI